MRPGNIHDSGHRAGPGTEPGRSSPERAEADARQPGSALVPGAAGEHCLIDVFVQDQSQVPQAYG
jgi:hypothetical protein